MSQGKLNGLFPPQSLSGVNSQQGMVPTPVQPQIGQFANTFGQAGAIPPAAPQNASLNPSQAGSVFTTGSYAVQPQTQIAPQTQPQTQPQPQIPAAPVAPTQTTYDPGQFTAFGGANPLDNAADPTFTDPTRGQPLPAGTAYFSGQPAQPGLAGTDWDAFNKMLNANPDYAPGQGPAV